MQTPTSKLLGKRSIDYSIETDVAGDEDKLDIGIY
jgi:hypothetical protein